MSEAQPSDVQFGNTFIYDENGNKIPYPFSTVKGNITYYTPGSYPFGTTNYVPTYADSIYLSKLTRQSTTSPVYNTAKMMSGFCSYFENQPQEKEKVCNQLKPDQCASTNCCVLLGGSKCISGNISGPTYKTNYGDIFSIKSNKMLKPMKNNSHYYCIKLILNNKRNGFLVHRLVAIHFIGQPEGKNQVNHIDGIKTNNNYYNLEWVSPRENQLHAFAMGLQVAKRGSEHCQSKPVRQISLDGVEVKVWESIKQIKRELGYNSFGIIKCCKKEKKYNTAYKFKWEYV
jgi:hypothetical protein